MSPPNTQPTTLEQGFALHNQGQLIEARALYRQVEPPTVDSFRLLGTVEHQLGNNAEALGWLRKSLDLVPDQYEVHLVMGDALRAMGRTEDAAACYSRALSYDRRYAQAYANRGNCMRLLGRIEAALDDFRKALLVNPGLKGVAGMDHYMRMNLADWRGYAECRPRVTGDPTTPPFILQSLTDDPMLHRLAAETLVAKMPPRGLLPALGPARRRDQPGERLRIGYFSSDFRNHPLTHLLAGLFETHDRARFEIVLFSFGGPPKEDWGRRVQAAADRFLDVAGQSAEALAQMARALEIDIAVDLTGLTEGCRADVFAERAAPVQAVWLGYLGTMGADYYDYLIADAVVIPPSHASFYTEKIARLPVFQINDDRQRPSTRAFTRQDAGLPEIGFVLASFNQVYKITPAVFDSWMRILARIPDGVLWIYCDQSAARDNLRAEAQARGVDPARLVFADPLQPEDHLARLPLADLFLDTFPYNAGATASGALRMGVPILTRRGESFAARMGASLLTAVGLPEMTTDTPDAYEDLAVALATDPARMAAVKAKLAANLPGSILFDTTRATRALEALYETMHERAANGLPPEPISSENGQ